MTIDSMAVQHKVAQINILQWHPSLNVYVLDNQDLLLMSASKQLFLPSAQFPFLAQIDGKKNAEQILQSVNVQQLGALFYYQVYQLRHTNLLIGSQHVAPYLRPTFDGANTPGDIDYRNLTEACQMVNLSALPAVAMAEVESVLLGVVVTINTRTEAEPLSLIMVDDFVDPRILALPMNGRFMVIKISGEHIWLSPLFMTDEMDFFAGLQQQILANQPVRQSLMARWPRRVHSFAFVAKQTFIDSELQVLCKLLLAQTQANAQRQLLIYRSTDKQVEYHAINPNLNDDNQFARQITAPIRLQSCIGLFNQDGGSRSITAKSTVDQLMPLVSPICGVINHLEELDGNSNKPIKIYRSGFFKSQHETLNQGFDQHGFVQICLGKGVSHEQSKASALAEAIERYCALYQTDIPSITSTGSGLQSAGKRILNFQDLQPYSTRQFQQFNDITHPDSSLQQAARPYDDSVIHWLPGWSMTYDETVYLPLSQCFSNIPFDDDQFGRWNSNGCAAGNTLEEAILQALLELIERDATALWWYNQVVRPAFDLSRLNQDNLAKLTATLLPPNTANASDPQGHDFWVLDLTHDLGIPVMAGIGQDKKSGGWIMGFGCHLIPEMAAQRALTELCQLIPIRDQNDAPFDFDAIVEGAYLYADGNANALPPVISSSRDIKQDILSIIAHLNDLGLETVVVDYTRVHIPLCTAKVFVPGLCHIWPQLANKRLYQVPVKLNWLAQAKTEASINSQALYI